MSDHDKRRSPHAQQEAMRRSWPGIKGRKLPNGALYWVGALRPKAQYYIIGVYWNPKDMSLPYVMVLDPPLKPREGSSFVEIPHLIFHEDEPTRSGLCLFDPEGLEWSPADLIAETTIFWASEWLAYYELWHMTGKWLAPGVALRKCCGDKI